jgi:hypothetical protein
MGTHNKKGSERCLFYCAGVSSRTRHGATFTNNNMPGTANPVHSRKNGVQPIHSTK